MTVRSTPPATALLATIRSVLFDMDGVLYRGAEPLPGVNELLAFLRQQGIAYACITNNATRTPAQIAAALQTMGIGIGAEQILTSALATNFTLRAAAPRGTPVYAIGMAGLTEPLFGDGYFIPEETTPRYVVVGLDLELTYTKLRTAALAIRRGATFIGTNPDRTLPMPEGLAPGAGSILAALEAATDRKPMIIGKPERAMFEAALALLRAEAATTLMVGDRYETDILGGAGAGLKTALVLTGVSTRDEALAAPLPPDLIVEDLPTLLRLWQAVSATDDHGAERA
ncbi:HAD-IIA family hydrolase [Kallotenue papyrolyticum]|uniref:HAD-IIA family hydrolase n=1 Tax=Kallotenue papyrolyticum TaxID=1325125 RepID=UPI0004927C3F|nr:HAD-IIA family hydrolase [Kallotenue papyrolyticum]